MDISGLAPLLNAGSLLLPAARANLQPLDRSGAGSPLVQQPLHHVAPGAGRALGVFRVELKLSLEAQFATTFGATQPGYARVQEPATAADVIAQTLGAAKQLVAESPTQAAQSLITFRAQVHAAASYVGDTVGDHDQDVDHAVAGIDGGLDALDDQLGQNRESPASVLAVDSRTRQRSSIRIRTQQGDIVKLGLQRTDTLSATDVATTDGKAATAVEVSTRSRMKLKVEGDLNESEFAAIQKVFDQAEQIANDFFGGDLAAAFDLAQGFEFDTAQLSRVNLRFRLDQETRTASAETVRPKVAAPAADTAALVNTQAVSAAPVPATPAAATGVAVPEANNSAGNRVPPDTAALSGFFETLSTFLRAVGDGFDAGPSRGAFSFHYSESFKLELLKAVIHTVAPDDSSAAAANAGKLIDAVLETGVPG